MDSFVFIHGSSEGQSVIIPSDSPASICNDIANKYFQGRIPRQNSSAAKLSMFVDLYKSTNGDSYSVYSFVNNDCEGLDGRKGQYFAISVLCKDYYVFPEAVYRMLHSAYSQMYSTSKIIQENDEGKDRFVIAQFVEQKEYFLAFLQKIRSAFIDRIADGQGMSFGHSYEGADYDSWKGVKVCIDFCNSLSTFKSFCGNGRLFISEEYDSPLATIKALEASIQKLELDKKEIEQKGIDAKLLEKSKAREEIETLTSQLKQKDQLLTKVQADNEKYQASFSVLRGEFEKFNDSDKVPRNQPAKNGNPGKDRLGILKKGLFWLLLLLTLASGIVNYTLLKRLSSQALKENKKTAQVSESLRNESVQEKPAIVPFSVSPSTIEAQSDGGVYEVLVQSGADWEIPVSTPDWVSIDKSDNEHLTIRLNKNNTRSPREYAFMVVSDAIEKQVLIVQEGAAASKAASESVPPNYGLIVMDNTGRQLNNGSNVYPGQTLIASVSSPSMASNGFGWTYSKCSGKKGNLRSVTITIAGNPGEKAAVGYGDLSNQSNRQRLQFNVVAVPSSVPSASDSN